MINARYLPEKLRDLTPIQQKYLNDYKHRFIIVSAGRRSRKTLIGRRKLLIEALSNPNSMYIEAAPTYPQAKAIFWLALKRETKYFCHRQLDGTLEVNLKNGTIIKVVGLDKPERIEGMTEHPVRGIHITETPNLKPTVWSEHVRPILSDTNGWAILDGVPEGKNFYYDMALKVCNGAIPKTVPKYGAFKENGEWAYYSWFSSDVLAPAEIEQARQDLDPRTFRQEYEGSFEGYEGRLYYAFGEHNLKQCEYDPTLPIYIGMDFNVNPMTAVLCHIVGDTVYQFDEFYLIHSNTYQIAEAINEKYPNAVKIVHPDSTGRALNSNATLSDIAILENRGFKVQARKSNPPTRDRIASVNSMMMSLGGKVRYYVNPKTCPKTINDFNKVEATPDGRENKEQEKRGLVHISSALGYLIYYHFPIFGQPNDWQV